MVRAEGSASKTLTAPRSDPGLDTRSHGLKNVPPVPQSSPHHSPLVAQRLVLVRQVAEHILAVFRNQDQVEQPFGKAWR